MPVGHTLRMACRDLNVAFNVCAPIVVTHALMTELCVEFRLHLCFCLEPFSSHVHSLND